MYNVKKENDKFYIVNNAGNYINDWDGSPIYKSSLDKAQALVDHMNNLPSRKSVSNEVTGVVDNRHRNWRKRSR